MVENSVLVDRKTKESEADESVTRRDALTRFVLLVGGAAAGSAGLAALAASSPAPAIDLSEAAGVSDRRRKIFQAILECYDGVAPIVVTADRDLAAELADRYVAGDPEYRRYVDALLDAVDSAPAGPRFADQTLTDRQATLHEWRHATEPDDLLVQQIEPPPGCDQPMHLLERVAMMQKRAVDFAATLSPEDREIDPVTMLPRFVAKLPKPKPLKLPTGGPLGTPVRVRRHLCRASYLMLAEYFVADPLDMRHL